jgi:hypothetical protein
MLYERHKTWCILVNEGIYDVIIEIILANGNKFIPVLVAFRHQMINSASFRHSLLAPI